MAVACVVRRARPIIALYRHLSGGSHEARSRPRRRHPGRRGRLWRQRRGAAPPGAARDGITGAHADGGALPLVFGNAFGAASGGAAGGGATLGPGDPSLEQYLLTQDDLPAGFIEQTSISQRVSDKISDNGAVDMSMSIAARGEPGVSTDAAMVMSMVMRFEDLQDLDRAVGQAKGVSEQDLQDELEQLG